MPVMAQQLDNTSDTLSLAKALEFAEQHHPQLKLAEERLAIKKSEKVLNLGISDPKIIYLKEGIDKDTFSEKRWGISQNIDFPLTSYYRRSKTDKEYASLQEEYKETRLNVRTAVKKAYTNLAYALEIIHLREEQVTLAERIEKISLARFDVGESSRMDVLQSQIQNTEAKNRLSEAQKMYHASRYDLFSTIGLDPDNQRYGIRFPDTLSFRPVDVDQRDVMESLGNHPFLLRTERLIDAAKADIKVSKSLALPALSGSIYRQDYGSGFDFTGFEVGISVPLWFPINQKQKIGISKARLRSQEWYLQTDRLTLKLEAEQAWHAFEKVQEQIFNYNSTTKARSIELLRLTQEAYQVGETPLINLLEAQRTYLLSQENYLNALKEYHIQAINLEKVLQKDIIYVD